MACRVGITADPDRREREWRSTYPHTFRKWQIVRRYRSRSSAQAEEDRLATLLGCEAHQGGREPESAIWWYVYKFHHDGY